MVLKSRRIKCNSSNTMKNKGSAARKRLTCIIRARAQAQLTIDWCSHATRAAMGSREEVCTEEKVWNFSSIRPLSTRARKSIASPKRLARKASRAPKKVGSPWLIRGHDGGQRRRGKRMRRRRRGKDGADVDPGAAQPSVISTFCNLLFARRVHTFIIIKKARKRRERMEVPGDEGRRDLRTSQFRKSVLLLARGRDYAITRTRDRHYRRGFFCKT
jgi:hypothetical protein